jgi:hypothetical protein
MTFSPPEKAFEPAAEDIPPLAIATEVVSPDGQHLPVEPRLVEAESVVSLPLRDLELLQEAKLVRGKHGVVWFDSGADGLEISAGDDVAFTHRSEATISGSSAAIGFGLAAGQLASVAAWCLNQKPPVGLDLYSGARGITAIPDQTFATAGVPLEACLVGIPDEPLELQSFLENNLPYFRLTTFVERPEAITKQAERRVLGPFDQKTLISAVSAVKDLVRKDVNRPKLQILNLRDGVVYGGGLDAVFLCPTPSLAGVDLSLTREQMPPLLRLLRFLSSQSCYLAHDGSFHIFGDSRTTLYFKIPTLRYPKTVPQLLEEQPTAGLVVEANQLRKRLDRLRLGRGADCPDAWLHVQLAAGLLKMEGRSSSDGEQTVKADHLPYGSDGPALEFNLLITLTAMDKALAGCQGQITLQAGARHFFVSGRLTHAPSLVRTVRLPAVQALPPDRLAREVRQLASLIRDRDRKRRAS